MKCRRKKKKSKKDDAHDNEVGDKDTVSDEKPKKKKSKKGESRGDKPSEFESESGLGLSKKQLKKKAYWDKRIQKKKEQKATGKERSLTEDQIEKRKAAFAAKKARREERRATEEAEEKADLEAEEQARKKAEARAVKKTKKEKDEEKEAKKLRKRELKKKQTKDEPTVDVTEEEFYKLMDEPLHKGSKNTQKKRAKLLEEAFENVDQSMIEAAMAAVMEHEEQQKPIRQKKMIECAMNDHALEQAVEKGEMSKSELKKKRAKLAAKDSLSAPKKRRRH